MNARKYPVFKRNKLYPYNRWFKKGILILRLGRDYHCTSAMMAQQLRNEANIRNTQVSAFMRTYRKHQCVVFINWLQLFKVKA